MKGIQVTVKKTRAIRTTPIHLFIGYLTTIKNRSRGKWNFGGHKYLFFLFHLHRQRGAISDCET